MTEFKQIIGRGTRVNEDHGKYFFNIIDFRKATELSADPQFDGDPVTVYEPYDADPITPDGEEPGEQVLVDDFADDEDDEHGRTRYVVADVPVRVIAERVQYYGPDGKLITESLRDYTKKRVTTEEVGRDYDAFDLACHVAFDRIARRPEYLSGTPTGARGTPAGGKAPSSVRSPRRLLVPPWAMG